MLRLDLETAAGQFDLETTDMSPSEEAKPSEQESGSVTPSEVPRTVHSDELLRGARELLIRHGEETYRLRLTRNGKLILQK